ncbi:MAG: TonB-dependent receptor [Pseudomonadota bacterium]|nr:TonB-dependent receptor [Pseudomonadota bacterium]
MGFKAKRSASGALVSAALFAAPVVAISMVTPAPAFAQSGARVSVDVPAGRLSSRIRILSRQTGVTIASRESGLRRVRARSVRGTFTARAALNRLLAGTPYRAVAITGGFRIERRPQPAPTRVARAQSPARPATRAAPPPPPPPPQPIIVEGTKRSLAASDYPGGVKLIALDDPARFAAGERLDTVLASIPAVNGTALGSGRNKIFLRGIADSSFNGPTQATIGLYVDEQRIIYSAPNPDLRLHDVETVEILEGPQGTLYGAGTLAGLMRIQPRAPDPSGVAAQVSSSVGVTQGGGPNWEGSAMANLPIGEDTALRIVGYGGEDSGYIDDPSRSLTQINSASHYGGRASIGFDIGPDWSVALNGFGQHSEMDDGQYGLERFDALARTDALAQPFRSRIYGGAVTVRGFLADLELVSVTGLVDNAIASAFNASSFDPQGDGQPRRQTFNEAREIRLISHETRLSGGDPDGFDWLVGIGALRNRERTRQTFEVVVGPTPPTFADQTYRLDEIALFAEASQQLSPNWSATAGARLLYTSASGERSFGMNTVVEPREGPARLLPAFALRWEPDTDWMAYLRYQQGFRTGGVTIERAQDGDPSTAQFDPDRVRSYEAGIRRSISGNIPLDVSLTAHHSDWRDIQADQLDINGFPITRNIGDGSITGVEGAIRFPFRSGWQIDLAAAWNDSETDRTNPDGTDVKAPLPNVPEFSASGQVRRVWERSDDSTAGLSLSGRYVGRSFFDLDQTVRVKQGNFASLDAAAWWQKDDITLRLAATNITNTRGNRFAFGNPFTARTERQITPLRPFTVELQITFRK